MNCKIKFADFHLTGHTAYPADQKGCRINGYSSPKNFVEDHPNDDLEGCIVMDKREVLKKNPVLAINLPMVDVHLENDEDGKCPEPSLALLSGLQGGFKTLAMKRATDKKWSGLDRVTLPTYLELWRKEGVKIGKIQKGEIIWESK